MPFHQQVRGMAIDASSLRLIGNLDPGSLHPPLQSLQSMRAALKAIRAVLMPGLTRRILAECESSLDAHSLGVTPRSNSKVNLIGQKTGDVRIEVSETRSRGGQLGFD